MTECIATLKVCQGEQSVLDYAFDLTERFSIPRQPNFPYASGARVRPVEAGTGRQYQSSGGVSNGDDFEPDWPIEDGESVVDGSLTWTAEAITFDSLRYRIDSVTWTAPDEITLSDETVVDQPAMQEVRVTVAGGTAGQKYRIVGVVTTTAGLEHEVRIELKVK
jgi:hypothetical protein